MIKSQRDQKILSLLEEENIVPVRSLYAMLSEVSAVTVRRDVARLADEGRLERVRGGVKRAVLEPLLAAGPLGDDVVSILTPDLELEDGQAIQSLQQVDVVILPPIGSAIAKTIYRRVKKAGVLCLDESSLEGEGVYLGVDNHQIGYDIGSLAAEDFAGHTGDLNCLVVGHDGLANTRRRAEGFLNGIREVFGGEVFSINVDAGGIYMEAFRQVRDALEAFPKIDLIFAINDHSVLAAIDAAGSFQRSDIAAYCIGGEGGRIFDELAKNEMLRGFGAMLPQVVARNAINSISQFFSGSTLAQAVITPHKIISPANLADYYHKRDNNWHLRESVIQELIQPEPLDKDVTAKHSVLFIQHYPTHHWYKSLSSEMRQCCQALGYEYHTASVKSQVLDELKYARHEIAERACQLIKPGHTIVLSGGEHSRYLAMALRDANIKDLTVVTNNLRVLELLADVQNLKVMLTGGVLRPQLRDLIGPSVSASLKNIRIDCAFLSVDGLSLDFGVSCSDEEGAGCLGVFSEYSRRTVILADHTIVDEDANFRAIELKQIDHVITDSGTPLQRRMEYTALGIGVLIAGDSPRSVG